MRETSSLSEVKEMASPSKRETSSLPEAETNTFVRYKSEMKMKEQVAKTQVLE